MLLSCLYVDSHTMPKALLTFCKDNLRLGDGPSSNGKRQDMPPPYSDRPTRTENVPPKPTAGLTGHHPSRSQEQRHGGKPRGGAPELDIFADPPEPARRSRMRRNSDSSIASKILSPEDERRRRERRHREREARHKDDKNRPPTSSKSKKPNRRLDVIDSLDVTSIYGTGRTFAAHI